jgi:hypothetical protein
MTYCLNLSQNQRFLSILLYHTTKFFTPNEKKVNPLIELNLTQLNFSQ